MRTTLAWCGALGPDFSLQAGPALRTICTPSNATYNITLTAFAGFNQPVTLASAGHPAGTTATFVPNPITPSGVSVLTIGQQSGTLEEEPTLITRGFVVDERTDALLREVPGVLAELIEGTSIEERTDPGLMKEKVRVELQRFFRKRSGRRPLVLPVIMEI